jgi:hypothetical protein
VRTRPVARRERLTSLLPDSSPDSSSPGDSPRSVVTSVLAVNAVIAAYVYDAFTEPADPPAAVRSPAPQMPSAYTGTGLKAE